MNRKSKKLSSKKNTKRKVQSKSTAKIPTRIPVTQRQSKENSVSVERLIIRSNVKKVKKKTHVNKSDNLFLRMSVTSFGTTLFVVAVVSIFIANFFVNFNIPQ